MTFARSRTLRSRRFHSVRSVTRTHTHTHFARPHSRPTPSVIHPPASSKSARVDKHLTHRSWAYLPIAIHHPTRSPPLSRNARYARCANETIETKLHVRFPPSAASASSALALSTTASLTPAGRTRTSGRVRAWTSARSAAVFSLSTTARARVRRRAVRDATTDFVVDRCAARARGAAVAARVVVADMVVVVVVVAGVGVPGRIVRAGAARVCVRRAGDPTSVVDGR